MNHKIDALNKSLFPFSRYAFVSHSETYEAYMSAMGMPGFVIRYLKRKAPSVRITHIDTGKEGDTKGSNDWYKWEYLVGEELRVSRYTVWLCILSHCDVSVRICQQIRLILEILDRVTE